MENKEHIHSLPPFLPSKRRKYKGYEVREMGRCARKERKALFRNYTKGWKLIWQLFLIPSYSKDLCFSAVRFTVLCTPCPFLCFISQLRKNLAPFTDLKEH